MTSRAFTPPWGLWWWCWVTGTTLGLAQVPEGSPQAQMVARLLESHRNLLDHTRDLRLGTRELEASLLLDSTPSWSSSPQRPPRSLGLRVVPYGVTDVKRWPRGYPLPSNVVTVHLSDTCFQALLTFQQQLIETSPSSPTNSRLVTVDLDLWKRRPPPGGGGGGGAGTDPQGPPLVEDRMSSSGLELSPWYELNVGEGGAGDYVVSVVVRDHANGGMALAAGVETFTIRAQEPEEVLNWDDKPPSPCLDLPSVDDSLSTSSKSPPVNIPDDLCARYRMNGSAVIGRDYYDSSQPAKNYPEYSREQIEKFMAWAAERRSLYYGVLDEWLYAALDHYSIRDKTVLLIGSNVPFYEGVCLAYGAASCVTLEYNKLRYDHPRLHTLQPHQFDEHYPPHSFDVVMSISSFEHDGLGRYGDQLNPEADLVAMAKTTSYLKEGGILLLAVPVGRDAVYFNSCRIYGKARLPLLFEKWDLLESFGFRHEDLDKPLNGVLQPMFVLTPKLQGLASPI